MGITSGFGYGQKDSIKVVEILQKADVHYYAGNMDSSAYYCLMAGRYARSHRYDMGVLAFISNYIHVLNRQGKYGEALELTREAVEIATKLGRHAELAVAYNNLANEYQYLGQLKSAATNYLNALIFSEKDTSPRVQRYTNNLASVFLQLEEKEKSYHYASKSLQMARNNNDSLGIASSLVNLSLSEIMNHRFEEAIGHLAEVVLLGRAMKDSSYVLDGYINMADAFSAQHDFSKALDYYSRASLVLNGYPSEDYELYIQWGFANNNFRIGSHIKAKTYLEKSIGLATSLNALQELRKLYLLGADIHEKTKEFATALGYRKLYEALNDSLINAETKQTIHRLEIEHQSSLKEKQIAEQKLALTESNLSLASKDKWLFIWVAIGLGLVSLVVFLLLYIRLRQRRQAEHVKIMEKQHHIQQLTARIEGEEKERARLARDLHDGVGGLLAAARIQFGLSAGSSTSSEGGSHHNVIFSMLDQASHEIRNIAHNLSPDVVVYHGLDVALNQFCRRISSSELRVECSILGEISLIPNNMRLVIYRVAQELLNNVVKHAEATHALVQVSLSDGLLLLTVEDNGVGYSSAVNPGIGLMNIESRIKEFDGVMSVESNDGKGTVVTLEFDVSVLETASHG